MNSTEMRRHPDEITHASHGLASRACTECSRRKAKCDYLLPRCGRCIQRNSTCYFPTRKRPGPMKGLTRGPPRHDTTTYTASLTRVEPIYVEDNLEYNASSDNDYNLRHDSTRLPVSEISTKGKRQLGSMDVQLQRPKHSMVELPEGTGKTTYEAFRHKLIHVYLQNSHRLFPCFPGFSRTRLLDQLASVDENKALLDSICAIATRFSDESDLFPQNDIVVIGDEFAKSARSVHLGQIHNENAKINIDIIKTSLLLTLYNSMRHQGLKGWAMAGETIRLAYEFELDKQDRHAQEVQNLLHEDVNPHSLSAVEREDRRFLWWSIWKLDVFYSGLNSRPFGIDLRGIETCLPSSSFLEMIAGSSKPPRQIYLSPDFKETMKQVRGLDFSSTADVQTFYFVANLLVRFASDFRRLNLASLDVNHEMFLFELSLSALQLLLPPAVHNWAVSSIEKDQMLRDRIMSESMLLLNLSSIILYLPNSNDVQYSLTITTPPASMSFLPEENENKLFHGLWYKCHRAAISIVGIIKAMSVQMISFLSPTATGSIWLAGVILTLQRAVTEHRKERDTLSSSITFLLAVLKRLASTWPSANSLHDSLESITTSLSTSMTIVTIYQLLMNWNGYAGSSVASSSLLHIPREDNAIITIEPPRTQPSTTETAMEKGSGDWHPDPDFDFDSFNDDLWPMENFSFTSVS